jgi:hypothetical protein
MACEIYLCDRSASAGNLIGKDASIISQPDPEDEAMSSSFNEDTDQTDISTPW